MLIHRHSLCAEDRVVYREKTVLNLEEFPPRGIREKIAKLTRKDDNFTSTLNENKT